MLRALLWKEWRELRLLRLTGLALGLVLPVAFLLGAESFRRGLLPFGKSGGYTLEELFFSVLPSALALALWPLMSLLTVAQAFCADRASGREAFLLERPVGRGRVFVARLLVSFGSVLVIVLGTATVGGVIAWLTTSPGRDWEVPAMVLAVGLCISFTMLLAGLGATPLLQSPMAAVLLAILLAGIPFLVGTQLGGFFPLATLMGVQIGLVLPWVLLPAYGLAAWLGLCRGEPAGRGRLKRSLGTIAAALGVVVVAFPILASVGIRLDALPNWIAPSPRDQAAVVFSGGFMARGWIVDLASEERIRFLPPPIRYVVWNEDGSKVAVLTRSGPLGSFADPRIEVYDAKGDVARAPIPVPEELHLIQTIWIGGDLVALANRRKGKDEAAELLFVRVEEGTLTSIGLPEHGWNHWLEGPTRQGALYLGTVTGTSIELRSVDLEHRSVAAAPVFRGASSGKGRGISPSGRYWLIPGRERNSETGHVVDLETGQELSQPVVGRRSAWLDDDRLAWIEFAAGRARFFVGLPGGSPRAVAEWSRVCVSLERSPGGDAALLDVRPDPQGNCDRAFGQKAASIVDEGSMQRRTTTREALVYEAETDRLLTVPIPSDQENGVDVQWAGARKLGRIVWRSLTFVDVGRLEKR